MDTVCVFLKDDKERIIFICNFVAGSKSVRSKQMAGYFLELYIYMKSKRSIGFRRKNSVFSTNFIRPSRRSPASHRQRIACNEACPEHCPVSRNPLNSRRNSHFQRFPSGTCSSFTTANISIASSFSFLYPFIFFALFSIVSWRGLLFANAIYGASNNFVDVGLKKVSSLWYVDGENRRKFRD